jgi:hypothetical protein
MQKRSNLSRPSYDEPRYDEPRWQPGSHSASGYGRRIDQDDSARYGERSHGARFDEDLDRGRFTSGLAWDDEEHYAEDRSLLRERFEEPESRFGERSRWGGPGPYEGARQYAQPGFGGQHSRGYEPPGYQAPRTFGPQYPRGFGAQGPQYTRGVGPQGYGYGPQSYGYGPQGYYGPAPEGPGYAQHPGAHPTGLQPGGVPSGASARNEPREPRAPYPRGPKGYVRSDERIREDLCDRLSLSYLDVSDVEVDAHDGQITLSGTVPDRQTKYLIEEIADQVSGVQDLHNRITIARHDARLPPRGAAEVDAKRPTKPDDQGKRPGGPSPAH